MEAPGHHPLEMPQFEVQTFHVLELLVWGSVDEESSFLEGTVPVGYPSRS